MLYIRINLKVINTIIEEQHQIIALALVATLKNLVGIVFQNIAGMILDVTTYPHLYLICLVIISIDLILVNYSSSIIALEMHTVFFYLFGNIQLII